MLRVHSPLKSHRNPIKIPWKNLPQAGPTPRCTSPPFPTTSHRSPVTVVSPAPQAPPEAPKWTKKSWISGIWTWKTLGFTASISRNCLNLDLTIRRLDLTISQEKSKERRGYKYGSVHGQVRIRLLEGMMKVRFTFDILWPMLWSTVSLLGGLSSHPRGRRVHWNHHPISRDESFPLGRLFSAKGRLSNLLQKIIHLHLSTGWTSSSFFRLKVQYLCSRLPLAS